jgi:ABC-type branched-subunit amino acid transport system substrate-binding protein
VHRFGQDRQSRFQGVSRVEFPHHVMSLSDLAPRLWRLPGLRQLRQTVCATAGIVITAGLLSACQTTQVSSPPPAAKPADTVSVAAPAVVPPVPAPISNVRVAVLLPLSGQAATVGQSLLNASQMAMFDLADDTYTLIPFDTQGTAEGATAAAKQALAQGAQVILGPLFGQSVSAVAAVAQAAQVPVISYSTNPEVAETGVYVSGFLLRDQARRLVEEGMGRALSRFAVFSPDTPFGHLMSNAFADAIAAKAPSVSLVAQEFYDPNKTESITEAAKRLLPGGDAPPRFDVLMVAESGQKLHEVMDLLTYAGLTSRQTQVVGPMLWGDRRVFTERTLQGAWFPAPPPASHDAFSRRYQALFGQPAPSIAGLGYDTTALTVVLGRQPLAAGQTTPFSPQALTSSGGFAGVDGVFRLRPDGSSERGLAVMEITNGTARQIGDAPSSFAKQAAEKAVY